MKVYTTAVLTLSIASVTAAHTGQRVWVDVNSEGKIITLEGPLGGAGSFPANQFVPSRVFTRDMGNPGDDDGGENYLTEFPGYERTQYPTTSFSGTMHFDITGEVLYYQPTGFVPVSTRYPTGTPAFVVTNDNGSGEFLSGTGFVSGGVALTVGSHGHPQYILQMPAPFSFSNGPDLYDGVYALPLRLRLDGYTPSDTYYLLLGRNASAHTLADADAAMNAALIPEPATLGLVGAVASFALRRRIIR